MIGDNLGPQVSARRSPCGNTWTVLQQDGPDHLKPRGPQGLHAAPLDLGVAMGLNARYILAR